MKISFVIPPANMSGGIRVIGLHAERLAARGHEVHLYSTRRRGASPRRKLVSLLTTGRRPPSMRKRPSHLDTLPVAHSVLPHPGPVTDDDLPDADIVIATWWETAHWVAALSPSKGAKAYFMQDYGAPGQELEKIAPTWRLPLHIITISEWLAGLVDEHGGRGRPGIVPNAVDRALFDAPPRSRRNTRLTVGYMHRNARSKGPDIAVAAIEAARGRLGGLDVVAYGSKKPMPGTPLPEATRYHLHPADAALAGVYAACDAWLFPSRLEGYGLPVLEAMACRTPVIATPAGAAPELVADGAGMLVPHDDPAAMAAAIVAVAEMDDAAWKEMSDRAHRRAHGYGWDDAAALFEAELVRAVEDGR